MRFIIIILLVLMPFAIGGVMMGCGSATSHEFQPDELSANFEMFQPGELIDFQLYNRYTIDTRGLREAIRVVEGTPYVLFRQLTIINRNSWNTVFNPFGDIEVRVEYDDFNFNFEDFTNNYFILTVGRELAEIRVVGMSRSPHRPHEVDVAVTFAEEYQDGALFIYIMDRIPFSWAGMSSDFYFMEGSERVFIGPSIHQLMETYSRPTFIMRVKCATQELAGIIEQRQLDNVTLTIYDASQVQTMIPLNLDARWALHRDGKANTITVDGVTLLEHIDLLEELSSVELIPIRNERGQHTEIFYIFETNCGRRILEVALWLNDNDAVVNGFSVRGNDIFVDVIRPFLPEEMRAFIEGRAGR